MRSLFAPSEIRPARAHLREQLHHTVQLPWLRFRGFLSYPLPPLISDADARILRQQRPDFAHLWDREDVETPRAERRAELALARHRGEPRAALLTPSWLLGCSGFTRFMLPALWTLSPDSTETKAIFPENPEGWLRRTTVTTDHRDEFALSHICALWSLPVGQVDALRRDDH